MRYDDNVMSLGDAIKALLKQHNLERGYSEAGLIRSWERIVGPMIANHTTSLRIRKRVLFIEVDSAALRNELGYAREKILKALNQEAGQELIDEIVFS
jgi:predicted nucleic acid-binding Zn ribbon protein